MDCTNHPIRGTTECASQYVHEPCHNRRSVQVPWVLCKRNLWENSLVFCFLIHQFDNNVFMHMYFVQCSHDREPWVCIVRHNIHFRTAFRIGIPEFPVVLWNYLKYSKVGRSCSWWSPYCSIYPICAKCKLQCVHESNIANLGTTALLIHWITTQWELAVVP